MSHDHPQHPHTHSHDEWESPGSDAERAAPQVRDLGERPFSIGIGWPVGSGKTALLVERCRCMRDEHRLGVVTNDIFTPEDADVITKTDPAPHVGADLGVLERDAVGTRGDGPTVFAQVVHGVGVDEIASRVVTAWERAS